MPSQCGRCFQIQTPGLGATAFPVAFALWTGSAATGVNAVAVSTRPASGPSLLSHVLAPGPEGLEPRLYRAK